VPSIHEPHCALTLTFVSNNSHYQSIMQSPTIRLSFRKAWSQHLASSFDHHRHPFLRQRFPFPRAKARLQLQARRVHKNARPSSAAEEDNPSPCCQLLRVFVFVQVALLASMQYLRHQNRELFKQTIDSRDHEIGYLRDKVAELQLQTKESHARGLER
jgi:hypothetical protein